MNTTRTARVPKYLSLLGLLGLIGLAGLFDPQFARFSALSFLSYACYFRFLHWFGGPQPEITKAGLPVWIGSVVLAIIAMSISPWLFSISPFFGFFGFAGFLGLYEPTGEPPKGVAA